MPDKIIGIFSDLRLWFLGAFTAIVGLFTALFGYHTKNTYVKKDDFKNHCEKAQAACNLRICGKIDDLKDGQAIVFNKLDSIIGQNGNLAERISALESAFEQYKEDKRNEQQAK